MLACTFGDLLVQMRPCERLCHHSTQIKAVSRNPRRSGALRNVLLASPRHRQARTEASWSERRGLPPPSGGSAGWRLRVWAASSAERREERLTTGCPPPSWLSLLSLPVTRPHWQKTHRCHVCVPVSQHTHTHTLEPILIQMNWPFHVRIISVSPLNPISMLMKLNLQCKCI